MTSSTGICGICVLRDAVDLVPFLCGHYLRIGFDRLVFIDDGSSDGTCQSLEAIAAQCARVSVQRASAEAFHQSALMTDAANRAIAQGYGIVFPFDADEFWTIDARRIRAACDAAPSGLLVGHWVQFVQDRRRLGRSRRGLLSMTHRAPHLPDTSCETVAAFSRPFVGVSLLKIAFKAEAPVEIGRGQHILLAGPTNVLAGDIEIFHLPLRSAAEIDLRARRAGRLLSTARPGESWQSRHFRGAVAAGRRDQVWNANSASRDGCLDLPSQRIPLTPDRRLRTLLLRAALYMTWHHPRALVSSMPEIRNLKPEAAAAPASDF